MTEDNKASLRNARLLLIVNVGSASVKTCLFADDLHSLAVLSGDYGCDGLALAGQDLQGHRVNVRHGDVQNVETCVALVLAQWQTWLQNQNVRLAAIGHRVVHGADWFGPLEPVTSDFLTRLAKLDDYAPLHNPFNRLGIRVASELFGPVPQFALFDTAFHRHLPEVAHRYALPELPSSPIRFRRFGFHGLSCQHSLETAAMMLARQPSELNLIVLHLGGGASVTAIRAGISVDTSMGFSPTEGLFMAKRCGDLDPMIVLALQRQGWGAEQLDTLLNHDSGLSGLCGETDMRRIIERAGQGDVQAGFAMDAFSYRCKKYLGAYWAVLGQVSALVFTGGIGEHAADIRERVASGLESFGLRLDLAANRNLQGNADVSANGSPIPILVIHAEEERVAARQILTFMGGNVL